MASPRILVVGGAGYIGSHMVKMLAAQSYRVTTLDNLSTGYRDAVSAGEFIQVDLADREVLATLFARQPFDAVMHFASYIQVGESVKEPSKRQPKMGSDTNGAYLSQNVGWVSVFCVTRQALRSNTTPFLMRPSGTSGGLRHKLRA